MKYTFVCKVVKKVSDTTYEVLINQDNISYYPDLNPSIKLIKSDTELPLTYLYVYDSILNTTTKMMTVLKYGVITIESDIIIPQLTPEFSEKVKQAVLDGSVYPVHLFKP